MSPVRSSIDSVDALWVYCFSYRWRGGGGEWRGGGEYGGYLLYSLINCHRYTVTSQEKNKTYSFYSPVVV